MQILVTKKNQWLKISLCLGRHYNEKMRLCFLNEKPIIKLCTFQKITALFSNDVRHFSAIFLPLFINPFAIFGS